MALNFLSGTASGSSSSARFFDVRLDNDYIIFRGNEDEAASAQVQGSVVLCLSEPLTIKHVKLTLSGITRMSWQVASSSSMTGKRTASKERTFFEKRWVFREPGKNRTEILKPDNYEFPFDVILPGSLPESVEGLSDAWVIYRFKAEIGRKYSKDIQIRKPLRIVRTLDSSALELSHAMSVENVWPNKIEYSISTPSKAICFGTSVQVDFRLVPLLKGLLMGNVVTQVREEQEFLVDLDAGGTYAGATTKMERVVASDEYAVDPDSEAQILDEEAEGYQFTRYLELPKTLNRCLQDCNVKGIKIRHKIKFNVQLHNPDGHISELRANLPVSFYISPAFPINENNDLVDQSPHAGRMAVVNEILQSAPPVYGEHQFDQLYSDVDMSGYMTPGNFSSPGTPYSHSRNISSDNLHLQSLEAVANGPALSTSPGRGQLSASALQSRLQNLRVSGVSSPLAHESRDRPAENEATLSRSSSSHSNPDDYFTSHSSSNHHSNNHSNGHSNHHSRGHSPPQGHHYLNQNQLPSVPGSRDISRRPSAEGHLAGPHTPLAQFFHAEDLARLPSYSTAVRSPVSRLGSFSGLPSYNAAITTTTTTTTQTAVSALTAQLAEPPTAHLRMETGRTTPSSRNVGVIQDEERRLRIMQARGR